MKKHKAAGQEETTLGRITERSPLLNTSRSSDIAASKCSMYLLLIAFTLLVAAKPLLSRCSSAIVKVLICYFQGSCSSAASGRMLSLQSSAVSGNPPKSSSFVVVLAAQVEQRYAFVYSLAYSANKLFACSRYHS